MIKDQLKTEENEKIMADLMLPMKIDPVLIPIINDTYEEMARRRRKLHCSYCGRVKKPTRNRLVCKCFKRGRGLRGSIHDDVCA